METQRLAIRFVVDKANEIDCNIYFTGDLLDTTRVPDEIMSMLIEEIHRLCDHLHFCFIAGNHDLPYHNWDNINRSSIGTLWKWAVSPYTLFESIGDSAFWVHFGKDPKEKYKTELTGKPLFIHRLVFPTKKSMPPNVNGITAGNLLKEYPGIDYICIGDYHRAYDYEENGRHVINPGTLLRQDAGELDYETGFYFVDTDKDIIEFIRIPDPDDLVTDRYLEIAEERNDRIAAFVESVESSGKITLSFEDNVKSWLAENREAYTPQVVEVLENLVWGENHG
jgi:DNA repair exonuclease SbcCD nuclease subunit